MEELIISAQNEEKNYWRDLWNYRELLYFLAWRDILVRYKQTTVGVAWALLRPIINIIIFTFLVQHVMKLATGAIPYPLFLTAGSLMWGLFAGAFTDAGGSIVGNANLISKIYFPRLLVPAATLAVGFIDFMISLVIIGVLMIWYQVFPDWRIIAAPFFIILALTASLGAGLWMAALTVKYRDFRFIAPFIVQTGYFVSPVIFPSDRIPENWRLLYSMNPMVGAIDGFRWSIFHGTVPIYLPGLVISSVTSVFLVITAILYFRRTEKNVRRHDLIRPLMSDYVISVEHLTKRYRLGMRSSQDGLRHQLERGVRSFFTPGKKRVPVEDKSEFLALNDVSFQVKPGEVLGIIGRNGAGKSTLLKILSRITPPTSGQIRVRGHIAALLEVGTGFHPDLTGRENIFLNGAILGMPRAEIVRKLDEIIAFAEIERFIDTPVKRYSSGMYVRLAFAVAAHLEPEILIVDEVLAVGDAQFQKKCIGKMNEVAQRQGRTVLFVSHQMAAVRKLCSSAMLLSGGKVAAFGGVEDMIQQYLGVMTSSDRVIDMTKIAHSGYMTLQTAKLERLTVDDSCRLAYGEPLVFHVDVNCETEIKGAVIGVGFDTSDGYRVMTLDSDVDYKELTLPKGKNRVTFRVPRNSLSPGLYNLSTAMFSGGALIDGCIGGTWEIVTGENDNVSSRGFGGVRVDFTTEVTSL